MIIETPPEHVHWTFTAENGYRSVRWFPTEEAAREGAALVNSGLVNPGEPNVYAVPAPQCRTSCQLDPTPAREQL